MDFITFYGEKMLRRFANLKAKDIDTKLTVIVTKDGYIDIQPDKKIGATPDGMANAMVGLAATAIIQYGDDMESKNELANNITFAMVTLFANLLGEEK